MNSEISVNSENTECMITQKGDLTMKIWIGKSLIVIGIIHTVFGLVVAQGIISEVAQEMFFNAIANQFEREAIFWFFITGFTLMIIGGLINWAELRQMELPPFLKWALLSLTVCGCFMMPASGFWTLFVPVVGLFLQKNMKIDAKT